MSVIGEERDGVLACTGPVGALHAIHSSDENFDFIDSLPVISVDFGGLVRWHCKLTPDATGPLFSCHSGAYNSDDSPVYNLVSRQGKTRVTVFHCRRVFKTSWSMLIYLSAGYRASLCIGCRMLDIVFRSRQALTDLPGASCSKIYAEYAPLMWSKVIFLISQDTSEEKGGVIVNSLKWYESRADLQLDVVSVFSIPQANLCLLHETLGCCLDDRWSQGCEVLQYFARFKGTVGKWLSSSDLDDRLDDVCPFPLAPVPSPGNLCAVWDSERCSEKILGHMGTSSRSLSGRGLSKTSLPAICE